MDKSSLKWIFKNTRFCILPLCVLTFVNVVVALISLALAYVTKALIDSAVSGNLGETKIYAVCFIGMIVSLFVLKIVFGNYHERVRIKAELSLRKRLLNQIIQKDFKKISAYHSGNLQARMFSDIPVIISTILSVIPSLAEMVTSLTGAFILLTVTDLSFGIIFLVAGILVVFIAPLFRKKIKNYYKTLQEKDAQNRSFIQELFINLLAVKIFRNEKNIDKKTSILFDEYKTSRLKSVNFSIFMSSSLSLAFDIGFLYALVWGAFNIYAGIITYGTLAAVLQLVGKLQQPLAGIAAIAPECYKAIASAERILEIENITDDGEKLDCSSLYDEINDITFKNVYFSYDGECVLENISATINKAELTAITGSSGIGKSTLLKLITGVYTPDSGEIILNTKKGAFDISKGTVGLFSYVPQGNMIFSGTIKDNITFASNNYNDEEINMALKCSCCDEFLNALPMGIDTYIGEKGTGLSEGQVQRLAIARALLSKNKILLLDEATSALDEKTEKTILKNISLIKDLTCIIVTHKTAALEICNKHLIFEEKKLYEKTSFN